MPSHPFAVLVLAAITGGLHAQQTWTVAADGSGQFTDLGAGIAAASDGDLIVVKSGLYAPITIDGKSLTVIGPGVTCFLTPPPPSPFGAPPAITIRNLAANQSVRMYGLSGVNFSAPPACLLLQDCAGPVWLEHTFSDSYGAPALLVERCADVVITDSLLQTNLAGTTPAGVPLPEPGARLIDSNVHAYDSEFKGSHGVMTGLGFPPATVAGDGGSGLEIIGSIVTLQGGRALGAAGSFVQSGACKFVGNTGDGVSLASSATAIPELRYRAFSMQHGSLYLTGPYCGTPPVEGVDLHVLSGTATQLAGSAHLLAGGGGFVAPSTATIEIAGVPGDLVALFGALPAPSLDVIGLSIHLGPSLIDLGFAVVAVNGKATLSIALQALPPGSPPFLGALQGVVLDAASNLITTGPSTIVVR